MIASAHIVAGVVIGAASAKFMRWRPGRVVAAFGVGVLLHLVMDAIPHADYHGMVGQPLVAIVAAECIAMVTISFLLMRRRASRDWIPSIVAAVLGSTLPDVKFFAPLVLPAEYARRASDWGERLHDSIHAGPVSPGVGMTTQLLAVLLLLVILAAFPRRPSL